MDAAAILKRGAVTLALLAGCGAAPPAAEPAAEPAPDDGASALAPLAAPGSRLSIRAPRALTRVPHTLRFEDPQRAMTVVVSDATVEPGTEPALAEAYMARIRRDTAGEVQMRPISLRGAPGAELTVRGEDERLRVLTVWRDGRIARLLVRHRPEDARLVEHVIDSARFDPEADIDPLAALELAVAVPEGLALLAASNEQLLLREDARPTAFPSADAALDVLYVPFAEGERPTDARTRGELLGSRFAGLRIDPPVITPVEGGGFGGIELSTRATADGTELALYGAYLEAEEGALLVRGSVDALEWPVWRPRFEALVRSLRGR